MKVPTFQDFVNEDLGEEWLIGGDFDGLEYLFWGGSDWVTGNDYDRKHYPDYNAEAIGYPSRAAAEAAAKKYKVARVPRQKGDKMYPKVEITKNNAYADAVRPATADELTALGMRDPLYGITVEELEAFHAAMIEAHKKEFGYTQWYARQPGELFSQGRLDPKAVQFTVGAIGMGHPGYSSSITVNLLDGTAKLSMYYYDGNRGTDSTTETVRAATIQQAEKLLKPALWKKLAAPHLAHVRASAEAFSGYLRGKYPNGIPAWPHTPD